MKSDFHNEEFYLNDFELFKRDQIRWGYFIRRAFCQLKKCSSLIHIIVDEIFT